MTMDEKEYHTEIINGEPTLVEGPGTKDALIDLSDYREFVALKRQQAINGYTDSRRPGELNFTTDKKITTLRITDANGIKSAKDAEYILEDVIPMVKGGFILIYAPKGSLKSFFALHCAFNLLLKGKRVLYMAGEGHAGYKNRLRAIEKQYGTEYDPTNLRMTEMAYALTNPEYLPLLKEYVGEFKPDLIIIDTLARHKGSDLRENDNDDMSEYVNLCNGLRSAAGEECTLQLYHHTPGGDEGKARGASAVINAADTAIVLNRSEDTLNVRLAFQKDGKDGDTYSFDFKIIDLGDGISSGVLISVPTRIRSMPKKIGQRELEILVFIGSVFNEEHGARFAEIKAYFNGKYSDRQLLDAMSKIKNERLIESRKSNTKDPYIPSAKGYDLIKDVTPDDRTPEEKQFGENFKPR